MIKNKGLRLGDNLNLSSKQAKILTEMHLQCLGFENVWREGRGRVKTPKLHLWCHGPSLDLWVLHTKQTAISVLKKTYKKS